MSGELRDTTGFLYEMGLLKRYKRTGWSQVGVPQPESIADHSFRVSVIASVVAAMEDADPQRAAFLALWHDSQETRTTDIPHLTKNYVDAVSNEQVTRDQMVGLPPSAAGMISAAVAEYEAAERRKPAAHATPISATACSGPRVPRAGAQQRSAVDRQFAGGPDDSVRQTIGSRGHGSEQPRLAGARQAHCIRRRVAQFRTVRPTGPCRAWALPRPGSGCG